MEVNKPSFKFITFAANENGDKIFCRLTLNNKTVLKGLYDFDKEKFIIKKYIKENFIKGIGKKTILKTLKDILKYDYDWEI
jgi:hypothetical protein